MSLIQQALDKTNRANGVKAVTPTPVSKTYVRDPMGPALERELSQVQQQYARRRNLYRKVGLAVLAAGLIAVLGLVGIHSQNSAGVETRATPQVPVKVIGGYLYRLTGITSINDKPIAVINNRTVGVGDKLNGRAVVTAIVNGEVFLDIQGKEIVLAL